MNIRFRLGLLAAPLALLVLLGQGCGGGAKKATGPDGGVFKTSDGGDTWRQLQIINVGAKRASIADMGIVTLVVDPQDPKAVYAGTVENGVIYSLDGGDSWQPANGLSTGRVNALAIDPKNKCIVYATLSNQIVKTTTCARDWTRVFFDPRSITFTALTVDWFNPQVVYAGTSDGDVLRSDNGGESWRSVRRIESVRINQIVVDPRDSRVVYAATNGSGILKTSDGGQNWALIRNELQEFENARRVNLIALDPNTPNRVYTISKYGIVMSDDGGATWKALQLPTPPGSVDMKAMAVHPKDPKRLVYATDKAVIWSIDGGQTWTTKKLPTSRGAAYMSYDGADQPSLYLGAAPATK